MRSEISYTQLLTISRWRSETSINGIKEVVQFSESGNTILVEHPGIGISGTASVSKNAKQIVFNR